MTSSIQGKLLSAAACVTLIGFSGCKKTADTKPNFTSAINTYYSAHPACLWAEPVKFPIQADSSNTSKTTGLDALVVQRLLTRTTGEKKEMILFSKQVTNYDISDQGRGFWTPDPNQPGFGNFCYGKLTVTTVDGYTPTASQPGATTQVNYHVGISGAPAWATAAETQNAFPQVAGRLGAPVADSATLTDTNSGWVVTKGPSFTATGAASPQ